ncbi:MAG TPA: ATP-binding protein, partial [Chitinophagaceae bacterium]|nr:ATP-binding protein [Chitinophagaceae bacterium]
VSAAGEQFDLYKFMGDILAEVEGMLGKKNQQLIFSYSGPTQVIQDKKILLNVLLNLLSNASKYSPEETAIELTTNVGNAVIAITVKDQGIGIPAEVQRHLFSPFFRAPNAIHIQGTGIGLNIVKKYVDLLNGSIHFTSRENEGTAFTIEIPDNCSNIAGDHSLY